MKTLYAILILWFTTQCTSGYTQTDDTTSIAHNDTTIAIMPNDSSKNPKYDKNYQRQIKLLFDVGNFAMNFADNSRTVLEFAADYHYINDWYIATEAGYAKGKINYDNLKYNSNSFYIRLGVDKCLLKPISSRDLDVVFFGFRYGLASGTRGDAEYGVPSQFGPTKYGTMPSSNFTAHWGEMTGGIRVEMWQGIYAGWNFRARFILNGKSFNNTIAPNYIAGYGKGDAATSFGFNVYLGYAIRWKHH